MRGTKQRTLSWAFLTRSGSERDLIDELGAAHLPEAIAEGVVVSASRPRDPDGSAANLAFARQAMRLSGPPAPLDAEILADRLAAAMGDPKPKSLADARWILQPVSPDSRGRLRNEKGAAGKEAAEPLDSSDPHDPRRRAIEALAAPLEEALMARLAPSIRARRVERDEDAEALVQAWAIDEREAIVGMTSAQDALSRLRGGKARLRRAEDAPSRSGLKLEEAIAWSGIGPDKGDMVADLGAAPGGWSQVAVGRGANVTAIDPGAIKIELPPKRFRHLRSSAFDFVPEETLDWVICDMAWRPLEVAQLLAKWGRRVWARQLITNFKLPMKKKAEILKRLLSILEGAGWRGLRARQLFHDRDEVTVFAWLDPNVARKGIQAPFELKSRRGRGREPRRAPSRVRGRGGGSRR